MTTSIQCVSLTPPGIVSSTPWNTVFLTAVVGVSNLSQSLTRRKWTQETHFSLCKPFEVFCSGRVVSKLLPSLLTKSRHHNPLLIIKLSCILIVHKARILQKATYLNVFGHQKVGLDYIRRGL